MTVTAKPARSRLDPEPISRRDWLGLASLWTMGAALLFGVVGMLRLPKAAVLSSPSKRFRVALPETLAAGQAFVPPGRSVARRTRASGVTFVRESKRSTRVPAASVASVTATSSARARSSA